MNIQSSLLRGKGNRFFSDLGRRNMEGKITGRQVDVEGRAGEREGEEVKKRNLKLGLIFLLDHEASQKFTARRAGEGKSSRRGRI